MSLSKFGFFNRESPKLLRNSRVALERRSKDKSKNSSGAEYFQRGRTVVAGSQTTERQNLHNLARRRRAAFNLLLISFCIVVFLVVFLSSLIHHVEVVFVDDSSIENVDRDTYRQMLMRYFQQRPLENIRPFLDVNNLNSFLNSQAPEIEEVESITTHFIQSSVIKLKLRQPVVLWEMSGEKMFVDKYGVAFSKNYFSEPEVSVIDKSSATHNTKQVANNHFLGFIGQVVALANEKQLNVERVEIPPLTTRQVEIRFTGYNFPVKMTSTNSAAMQVEDASKVLLYLKDKGINPSYIDVRVPSKAYYK